MSADFGKTIAAAYAAEGPTVDLGRGVHDGVLVVSDASPSQTRSKMMNRHGLIAGATGTGQDQDAAADRRAAVVGGRAVFAADVKGDCPGVARGRDRATPAENRTDELGHQY